MFVNHIETEGPVTLQETNMILQYSPYFWSEVVHALRNSHNLYNFAFTNKVVYFPHSWTQNQLPNAKSLQEQSSHVPADRQVTG